MSELTAIQQQLQDLLSSHCPPLQVRTNKPTNFEVAGTKATMQGKQKVDGIYFASVVPKPKDIRLYFFPIYTHVDQYTDLSPELKKCLKGKSCFHIKQLNDELASDIAKMIDRGVQLYKKDDLI